MKKRTYDKAFYQKLWGLMIPIVLQNLMLALVAVADAFMLGGNGSELYVCCFLGNADPVYPEYVSGGSNSKSRDSGRTVLGERGQDNIWMRFSVWRCAFVRSGICWHSLLACVFWQEDI